MIKYPYRFNVVSTQRDDDWRHSAACLDTDPELPFGDSSSNDVKWFVREVCGSCPVKAECLEFALASGCEYGVFGGVVPSKRARMPKPRRPSACGTQRGYRRHKRAGEDACQMCKLAARLYDEGRRTLRARQVVVVPFDRHVDEAA